ncbi:MAG TPA: 50S ribosomal protein L15 [Acidimicrobiia bacterium]|uniref:Large ribosomal subunit protein uL15 n=1 Tax=uncultured actinobacterium Rifle_16ft_4_minimus_9892 TaxID=1665150 RepID=A0A0H4TDN7_9ACTN|nr:50S ribosomal protein L15 [uncultured actinobacterium Rifle_16ft_4_minimus_9892]HLA65898.1 50S ribosomal protein L15 [Acidimicrobiia bacterium]
MKLHHLKPAPGSKTSRTRVGRGVGGKGGKTAGRGTKGTGARTQVPAWFEGGQMPLYRRLPKLKGFRNRNKITYVVVNVERLNGFTKGSVVGPEELRTAGLIKRRGQVKVLGEGALDKQLTVRAHAFSVGAVERIQAAGGSVEVIE